MPARVGVYLRPVEPDRAHLQHAHLAREPKDIHEQFLDVFQEAPPKRRDRVVVGMFAARNVAKRHRIPSRPLQLAAGEHARRIAVNQNVQQRPRMIRSRTGPAIRPAHPAEVETVDHIDNESRQVLLGQPFVDRGRKQIPRLPIDHPEIAHAAQFVVGPRISSPILLRRAAARPPQTALVQLSPTGC